VAESDDTTLAQAWERSYLDAQDASRLGRAVAERGGPLAGDGWLLVALCEARLGDAAVSEQACQAARERFLAAPDPAGLAWCDLVHSILLRRQGDIAGTVRIETELAKRTGFERTPMFDFVSHTSRAITLKVQGACDDALHHFYDAQEAASRTPWAGPTINALANLAVYHRDLFNLEDARTMSEQAVAQALQAGAKPGLTIALKNLVAIHYATGQSQLARAATQRFFDLRDQLTQGAVEQCAPALALGYLAVGELDEAESLLQLGAASPISNGDGLGLWTWIQARCLLARHQPQAAKTLVEQTLAQRETSEQTDRPYDQMQMFLVLGDACEALGDTASALRHIRQAHSRYEQLVGRSARARFIALEVSHQLKAAQHERDAAVDSRRTAENDRQRLAELNAALQEQIARTEALHVQLREQALIDPLTGLHNRRYLYEAAPGVLDLAKRHSMNLCVVLLDLDHFKLLNDTYGHQAGDWVLQRFGQLLKSLLRSSDLVCRHGGEEFVAIMPDIGIEDATLVLRRLLQAFQTLPQEPNKRRMPSGSFSAGIALFPRHGHTLDQLLVRADRALYAAKDKGRARIESAPTTGFGTLV
jgi:diguanylate cyclase (GGDEF)-like protein